MGLGGGAHVGHFLQLLRRGLRRALHEGHALGSALAARDGEELPDALLEGRPLVDDDRRLGRATTIDLEAVLAVSRRTWPQHLAAYH